MLADTFPELDKKTEGRLPILSLFILTTLTQNRLRATGTTWNIERDFFYPLQGTPVSILCKSKIGARDYHNCGPLG